MLSRPTPKQQVKRQLLAILAADIAGYSRLMGAEEEGTLTRLKTCRRELIEPCIAKHHGRIVNTAGDGILIEVTSPVEAVRCGVEMQQGMIDYNASVPDNKRIEFRIGINLGDVIVDERRDLYGDAVNIASRLEALAEPGGVCISRAVRDQIRDRLALPFVDIGEQSVKNIARPVRVYALSAGAVAALSRAQPAAEPQPARLLYAHRHVFAAAVASLLAIGGGLSWLWSGQKAELNPQPERAILPTSPRLSIVVLPFANLSNDPEQEYFADGITEDLTTDLSSIADSFVIAHSSTLAYKGKPVDAKQIGHELGVRYVLEGSVRRSGKQVRVNAQLIDAETGAHLWAQRFDRDAGDLFGLESEITGRITRSVRTQLIITEAGRSTVHPDALEYILRARAKWLQPNPISRENYAEVESLFERALALDPHAVGAQTGLAGVLTGRVLDELSSSPEADLQRAEELIEQALASSPHSAEAHYRRGNLLRARFRCEDAIPEYETAIALDRNYAKAYAYLGACKLVIGSIDEVVPLMEQAIRLSPHDSYIAGWYWRIGAVHLLEARTDEAIVWLEKARSARPAVAVFHAFLAAAYALKGTTEHASAELGEAQKLDNTYSSLASLKKRLQPYSPKIRTMAETTYFAGLRLAGMAEE